YSGHLRTATSITLMRSRESSCWSRTTAWSAPSVPENRHAVVGIVVSPWFDVLAGCARATSAAWGDRVAQPGQLGGIDRRQRLRSGQYPHDFAGGKGAHGGDRLP